MTARRDLAELARRGQAQRTHGGAVMPAISAHDDSFALRLDQATDAKLALSEAALELVRKGDTVFLDSSSTSYFVGRRLLDAGLEMTLLTNSLPVMQMVGAHDSQNICLSVSAACCARSRSPSSVRMRSGRSKGISSTMRSRASRR